MKRSRVTALAISLLTATGLGLGLACSASATPAHPASATPAHPASAPPSRMVVLDCLGHPVTRPHMFVLACADGNYYFDRLSWTSWTPNLASASGRLVENDCTPSCAAGHFHSFPALIVFWGNAAVKNHPGEHRYTMLTQILPGPRPRYYNYQTHKWVTAPVTQNFPLSAS
jgi:hypothetical protein